MPTSIEFNKLLPFEFLIRFNNFPLHPLKNQTMSQNKTKNNLNLELGDFLQDAKQEREERKGGCNLQDISI